MADDPNQTAAEQRPAPSCGSHTGRAQCGVPQQRAGRACYAGAGDGRSAGGTVCRHPARQRGRADSPLRTLRPDHGQNQIAGITGENGGRDPPCTGQDHETANHPGRTQRRRRHRSLARHHRLARCGRPRRRAGKRRRGGTRNPACAGGGTGGATAGTHGTGGRGSVFDGAASHCAKRRRNSGGAESR